MAIAEPVLTPHFADDWLTVYGGDCRDVLATLPAESIDCIVTSPPYWGLRDYGHDDQLGLERTPEEYVAHLVDVGRALWRVLRPTGTLWLNLGDSYAGSRAGVGDTSSLNKLNTRSRGIGVVSRRRDNAVIPRSDMAIVGLKPKDLVGIPWRVAFALQADGWWLRSDIVWAKPNPMPESVTDRPTKAHEYLFLLTKAERYYYDAEAIAEASVDPPGVSRGGALSRFGRDEKLIAANAHRGDKIPVSNGRRNVRSVWTMATRPYPGSHFAVFPPELPERCIKAGSSEKGVCPECGAPGERITEKSRTFESGSGRAGTLPTGKNGTSLQGGGETLDIRRGPVVHVETTGWRPTCLHMAVPVPAVILDPFAGSGTVGLVANRLSRRAVLIDLNPEYLEQQMRRNAQTPLGLVDVAPSTLIESGDTGG